MALGDFTLTIDADQIDGTDETTATLVLTLQGEPFLLDDTKFRTLSKLARGVQVSLPYTVTLPTDVAAGAGVNSTTIGFDVTLSTKYGSRITTGFAARPAGTALNLRSVTERETVSLGDTATAQDATIAARINDPASNTSTALSAKYAPKLSPVLAALGDAGTSLALGLVGDSTGNGADEWFYLLGQYLAQRAPDYTVKHRLWNDTTQEFDPATTIQTGPLGVERAVVFPDASPGGAKDPGVSTITGDIDIRVRARLVSWTSGDQTFASRFGNGGAAVDRSFRFQIGSTGMLKFDWSTDGSALQPVASSGTAVPFAAGAAGWVRVVLDVDNGATQHTVKFYTSTDGVTWTQLGATVTRAGVTSLAPASSYNYEIGVRTGGAEWLKGRIYDVEIRNGIDGPTVCPRYADLWQLGTGTGRPSIEGDPILWLVNGSHSGATLAYLNETTRVKKMVPDYRQALQFFSASHNELHTTGPAWVDALGSWVNNALARIPLASPVMVTQNPRTAAATPPDYNGSHATRRAQTLLFAKRNKHAAVDTYGALLDADPTSATTVNADGIHPTATGSAVWRDAVIRDLF